MSEASPSPGVLELENGIFNLMVHLVRAHQGSGLTEQAAKHRVAELFDQYGSALRSDPNGERTPDAGL